MEEEKEQEQETNKMGKEEEQVIRWTGNESSTVHKDYQYRRFVGIREGRAYKRRRGQETMGRGQAVSKKAEWWHTKCGGVDVGVKED